MSTNSMIGKQNEDESITAIYCHWDGHLESVGTTLRDHYTKLDKIDQLMALGDVSSLGPEIGEKHDFDNHDDNSCTAYGRDRGNSNREAVVYDNFNDFAQQEYNYLWKDGCWNCYAEGGQN